MFDNYKKARKSMSLINQNFSYQKKITPKVRMMLKSRLKYKNRQRCYRTVTRVSVRFCNYTILNIFGPDDDRQAVFGIFIVSMSNTLSVEIILSLCLKHERTPLMSAKQKTDSTRKIQKKQPDLFSILYMTFHNYVRSGIRSDMTAIC